MPCCLATLRTSFLMCHKVRGGACSGGGEGAIDSLAQWQQMVRWQNEAVDIASLHVYDGARGCWFPAAAPRLAVRSLTKALHAAAHLNLDRTPPALVERLRTVTST